MPPQEVPPGSVSTLRDARPLPAGALPDPAAVFAAEGEAYNLLFHMLLSATRYAPCASDPAASLPPGWQLEAVANLTQAGQAPPLPFVYLLSNPQQNQLAFLVRGTSSSHEWTLNAQYNQVLLLACASA